MIKHFQHCQNRYLKIAILSHTKLATLSFSDFFIKVAIKYFSNQIIGVLWIHQGPRWILSSQFMMYWIIFPHILKTIDTDQIFTVALCSRNFQNVKLRLHFFKIWSFYRHTDFTWNPILVNSNGAKIVIFGNFRDSELWILVILALAIAQSY